MLRLLGNIIWILFGGFVMGVAWWVAGLFALITIVGIPWARSCFVLGLFAFWPFGREAVNRRYINGREDIGTGCLGLIGNIVWFVLAGIWLAMGHLAAALLCFITIIGIPFGVQHMKLALIALAPVGQTVVKIGRSSF